LKVVVIVIIAIGFLVIIFISWVPNAAPHKQEAVILGRDNNKLLVGHKPCLFII